MRAAFKDIASGAFLLILALALHLTARTIPPKFPIGVDSGFLPEIVTAALAVLAVIIIIQGFRSSRKDRSGEKKKTSMLVRVGLTLALIAGYGAGLSTVGFLPATLVFLTLQICLLSPKTEPRWKMAGAVSAVTTLSVYGLFTYAFGVVLPAGNFW